LSLRELTPDGLQRFFQSRRREGYTHFLTPRALKSVSPYLRAQGALSSAPAPQPSPLAALLRQYAEYLSGERLLCASSVRAYTDVARAFLARRLDEDRLDFAALAAKDVISFVLENTRRYRTGATNYQSTALRALLLYLYLQGRVPVDLRGAVPTAASWRLVGVPKGLNALQLRRLLGSCDRRRRAGRRDYAVLLLLARLGLRRGEVAALKLDDVDWTNGELRVSGKGQREARLPLPSDVGHALARYLSTARPSSSSRSLFLGARAPFAPMTPGAVSALVRARCTGAGLPPSGAHRLRHTAATAMLRAGGSLDEVAQVLRHRSPDTTALYAKVDRRMLGTLARRWPEERA
jgi:integrase